MAVLEVCAGSAWAHADARARLLDVAHEFRAETGLSRDSGEARNKPTADGRHDYRPGGRSLRAGKLGPSASLAATLLNRNRQYGDSRLAAGDASRHGEGSRSPVEQPCAVDRERIDGRAPASGKDERAATLPEIVRDPDVVGDTCLGDQARTLNKTGDLRE